jgi:hypothetical protein
MKSPGSGRVRRVCCPLVARTSSAVAAATTTRRAAGCMRICDAVRARRTARWMHSFTGAEAPRDYHPAHGISLFAYAMSSYVKTLRKRIRRHGITYSQQQWERQRKRTASTNPSSLPCTAVIRSRCISVSQRFACNRRRSEGMLSLCMSGAPSGSGHTSGVRVRLSAWCQTL